MSIPEIIEKAVNRTDKLLEKAKVDDYHSGSTLTGILIKGRSYFSFNVGDSRTILIKFKSSEDKVNHNNEVNKKIISNNEENKLKLDDSSVFQDPNYSKVTDEFSESYQKEAMCKFEIESLTKDHN